MDSPLSRPVNGAARSMRIIGIALLLACILCASATPALAQGFSTDARMIAMGGSDQSSDSTTLADVTKSYSSIGIPLGLVQLYRHRNAFNPKDKVNFNPLLAIEDLSNPMHITFGRKSETQGELIVRDLINGNLNRDLSAYKGFVPKSPMTMSGTFTPDYGKTIRLLKVGKLYQGIFVGAGPYLTASTDLSVDPSLVANWSGASAGIPSNASLYFDNITESQAAVSITGGYRGRYGTPKVMQMEGATDSDGVYVSVNYHYIHGLHYDRDISNARFDTDAAGLIALSVPAQPPVVIDRTWSNSGTGHAVDFGTNIVTGPWDFHVTANGVGNHIVWKDPRHQQYTLSYLLDGPSSGMDFVKSDLPVLEPTITVKLPVSYAGGATYRAKKWTGRGQLARGVNGREYHFGGEYHFGPLDLRGGGRVVHNIFNPMGGIGLNVTKHFGIDTAIFTTISNAQQDRRASVAISLRVQ
jgi:hypothetical protein